MCLDPSRAKAFPAAYQHPAVNAAGPPAAALNADVNQRNHAKVSSQAGCSLTPAAYHKLSQQSRL